VRWLRRIGRKLGLPLGVNVGDTIKSWDVLTTTRFIQQNVSLDTPILDIGAYASEILCALHRLHYSALTGVDLNPALKHMPYAEAIRYEVADFMRTPFPDGAFGAITAISVIEHGFQSQPLLHEVTRLLRPGGYFIASFDYWPDKVDTTGIDIFGMDWRIFSRAEVLAFLDEAQTCALNPCGAVNLKAETPTMLWSGRRYTFAWLALQKQP
jgi:SAM-dependent methyltransferase